MKGDELTGVGRGARGNSRRRRRTESDLHSLGWRGGTRDGRSQHRGTSCRDKWNNAASHQNHTRTFSCVMMSQMRLLVVMICRTGPGSGRDRRVAHEVHQQASSCDCNFCIIFVCTPRSAPVEMRQHVASYAWYICLPDVHILRYFASGRACICKPGSRDFSCILLLPAEVVILGKLRICNVHFAKGFIQKPPGGQFPLCALMFCSILPLLQTRIASET